MSPHNTPPVSPREPDMDEDSDEDPGIGTLGEDDFEIIEVLEDEEEEQDENGEQDDEQDIEEDSVDVPDDAIVTFKLHGSMQTLLKKLFDSCVN